MASPDLNELIRQLRKSRQPIYETIVRTIRELINSGEWPENSRLPADKKLAAELGINHITLARALNSLRSQGYLDRRRFHGTFVLAPQKKDISDSVMRKVAVVFDCAHEDTFQQRLFLWLHTYLERSGFAMIFYASDNDPKKQFRQLWQIINDPALSGCIVWPIMPQRMVERLIRKCPGYFPLVTLDRYYTGAELDAATYDNYGCARDMTKTLIAAGVQNLIWLEDSKDHLLSG